MTKAAASDGELRLNDPVLIERGGSQKQEGVVAYLGRVQFANGDDWVGIRLTGSSVGCGRNDGHVNGVFYFGSGPNCGIFVRRSHVSKRQLNRLEELRLRRELAIQRTASPPKEITVSPSRSLPSRTPIKKTPAAAASTIATPATMSPRTKQNRLNEIRERRAALDERKVGANQFSSPSSHASRKRIPPPVSPTPKKSVVDRTSRHDGRVEEIAQLEGRVEQLADELRRKEDENTSLQKRLAETEQELEEANKESGDMADLLHDALHQLEDHKLQLRQEERDRAAEIKLLTRDFQTALSRAPNRVESDVHRHRVNEVKLVVDEYVESDKGRLREENEALKDRVKCLKKEADELRSELILSRCTLR